MLGERQLDVVVLRLTVGILSWRRPRVAICLLPIVVKWFVLVGLAPLRPQCVFVLQLLTKSFLDSLSYHPVAGSHKQVQLCFHAGGLKSALLLFGLLKMRCWEQKIPENLSVFFLSWGILSLCSCVNFAETFGMPSFFSNQGVSVSSLFDQATKD